MVAGPGNLNFLLHKEFRLIPLTGNAAGKPVQSGCSVGRPNSPNVAHWRLAEETFVFAGELSDAFEANFEGGC
jgi:hypothetical protein